MPPIISSYLFLAGAIGCEILGTMFLQKSEQFSRLLPTMAMIISYTLSMYCLSQTLKVIPLGIAYALWGGLGITLTTVVGLLVFNQKIDLAAIAGIVLILAGTVVINLFSSSVTHG